MVAINANFHANKFVIFVYLESAKNVRLAGKLWGLFVNLFVEMD